MGFWHALNDKVAKSAALSIGMLENFRFNLIVSPVDLGDFLSCDFLGFNSLFLDDRNMCVPAFFYEGLIVSVFADFQPNP